MSERDTTGGTPPPNARTVGRRTLIKRGALGAAAVGVGGAGAAWSWMVHTFGWGGAVERVPRISEHVRTRLLSVEQRVRTHFDYLDIDEDGLRAFADLHREAYPDAEYDFKLYERFLLSTDFFLNGADEGRVVTFVRYYDPYRNPCWNPCAVVGPETA